MDIRHVAGKDNVVTDALSWAAISAISGGINFSALAAAQLADPVDMAACQTASTGHQLKDIPFGPNNKQLYYVMRLLVSHVPTCLSPSVAVFSTFFMASATRAYGQPAN